MMQWLPFVITIITIVLLLLLLARRMGDVDDQIKRGE